MLDLQTLLQRAEVKASELNPYLHDKALELVKVAFQNGWQIIITQGYRSIAEQNKLYAQGRTTPGQIVTNAKGGQSNHNYRLAFDIAVLNSDGLIDWNTDSKYRAIGPLGQSIGLDWGGAWTTFVDLPHFEFTYGLSLHELQQGVAIPDYPANYKKEEDPVLNKDIANNIIDSYLSPAWWDADQKMKAAVAKGDQVSADQFQKSRDWQRTLANALRDAAGIKH